ncbi:hypothetical protein PAF17_16075 [Paracoccus sp. Z330]|uniref:Uncharacterized protein n=1 Tax=Paracoccus onchidii TaxID=3017813 RepID=A0ABT4ZJY2_9RHOB|nr:hypothetical protein [Paracoccus onchidii]MDB6179010.1 hypothetical protein [Paracoccus onchidii]
MSGLGAGIAALVNGYVGGKDIKQRWEDRADQKEWNKELRDFRRKAEGRLADRHGWAGEQQGWARDRHGAFMDQSEQRSRAFEQAWNDDQSMRGAFDGAVSAAESGLVTPTEPEQVTSASTKGPVQAVPMGVSPDAPQVSAQSPQVSDQSPQLGAQPPQVDPLFSDAGDGRVYSMRPPRNAEEKAQIALAAKEGRLIVDDATAQRQGEIDRIGNARATAGPVQQAIMADPDHRYGQSGGAGADVVEAGKAVARGAANTVDAAANIGLRGVRQVNKVVNPISEWITGKNFGEPANADWSGGARDQMPAPARPKGATKVEADTAAGAAQVIDQVGDSPAMQAAAEATPLGVKPGQPMTVRQRKDAADSFMQSYIKNGAPVVIKEMMRQGKFSEAESLQAFIKDESAQEGLRQWSGAVFAALNGDVETAAEAMMDAYNSAGYYDDGFEILKDETSLIRDDSGEVTGVRLAMKNQQTGQVSIQEESISDVINKGLWLTSPEQAMQSYIARQQAVQDRLLEADQKRQEAAIELIKNAPKEIREMAQFLMEQDVERRKNSFGRDETPPLTPEEAMAQAQALIAGGGAAQPQAGGETPVLRRGG